MHVLAHFPHSSAVLLDQTDHEATNTFPILLVQLDQKLGVIGERLCRVKNKKKTKKVNVWGLTEAEVITYLLKFLQPPAVDPLLQVPSNFDRTHFEMESSLRASGVRLQISSRE